MQYARSTLAVAAVISVANAHMFISSPSPIPGSAPKDPLVADGSNFPCHGVALPGAGGQVMPVGSQQLLSFDTGGGYNTAVHGGGSCQLSLTYETDPVAIQDPANWRVIYSIEEGCPTNSPGNLDGGYTGPTGTYSGSYLCNDTRTNGFDCVNQFNFSIPEGVANGQATLAWTWFNAVGNREMYMNCVAVDITGGEDDVSVMDEFPSMFVANLDAAYLGDAATCATLQNQNVEFPDPGQYLLIHTPSSRMYVASATSQYPISPPTGCPSNAGSGVPANAGSGSSPSSLSSSSSSSSTASSTSSIVSSQSTASSSFLNATTVPSTLVTATVPASSSTTAQTTTKKTKKQKKNKKTKAAKQATKKATTISTPASEPTTAPVSSCPAGSVPCSSAFICVDAAHFGLCNYNGCAISQAVAPGTACKNGAITWA